MAYLDTAFHQAAKAQTGELAAHLDKKPTNYLIAVQWHDNQPDTLQRQDFVWIKGNAKVSVAKVHEAYLQQAFENEPIQPVSLKLGGYAPSAALKMASLDRYHDRFVVLKAERGGTNPGISQESPIPLGAASASSGAGTPVQPSFPNSPIHSQARANTTPSVTSMNTPRPASAAPTPQSAPGSSSRTPYIKPEQSGSTPYPMGQRPSQPSGKYGGRPDPSTLTPPAVKQEVPLPPPLPVQPYIKPEDQGDGLDQASEDADEQRQDDDQLLSNVHLQELAKETSPEKLEQGVRKGVLLLEQLKQSLTPAVETDDGRDWLAQIEAVRNMASRARTVVGVVGNTGSGKSSCINALLEYERLVPTNCMRACTAVVTEMSYNESDDEASKFRAEIEFIQPAEWEKELKVLFDEVIDPNGTISRDVYNADSDAGVAYAKIRAVYYKHTKEEFASSSVEKLMREQHVRAVLGSVKEIKERDCDTFYKRLQHYVDSKEKAESTKKMTEEEKKSRKREMEFWPLIKVVRIYVKAVALSTGAVIVDLPGVHDSNAARAAVAEGYMKQCTGLWIVAPITRAVDDKAAKNLLGETFRRQLKYDGTYSAVTFICSKTDDISNTEATDSLGLGDKMAVLDDELYDIDTQRRRLKKQWDHLKDEKATCRQTMDDADEQQEVWEKLLEDLEAGKTVYAPNPNSKKRKRSSSSNGSDDGDDDYDDDVEKISPPEESGPPLTEDQTEDKISELKTAKKDARRRRSEIEAQMKELNAEISELDARSDTIESKRSAICIAGRNKYSKSAIQVDFAAGIKELDQENQVEEDEDNFDPDEDIRDYEAVARSLPVFCVSSRAYQKLSGRLVKDHAVKGFTDVDETEIPALQSHAKKLTEGSRTASCRRFLNNLMQLRTSMNLWASNDGTGAKLSDAQRDTEQKFLSRRLKELEKSLETCVDDTLSGMKDALNDNIYENFDNGVRQACDAALPTSTTWGAYKEPGGMHYSTYKATVRRDGVYSGATGPRDLNAELTEPLYKHLATGWEKAFQRRLPHVLKACSTAFSKSLRGFHKELETRARARGGANPRLGMLEHQLKAYEAVFTDLANRMVESINEQQREANREFTPSVCQAMRQAYQLTTDERGKGSYVRMKAHMASEVDANKGTMFGNATQTVRDRLDDMCRTVKKTMEERTDEIYVCMRRDYYSVLGNLDVAAGQLMPKWERSMRGEIEQIILDSEKRFKGIIDGEVEVEVEGDDGVEADAQAQEGAANDEAAPGIGVPNGSGGDDADGGAADAVMAGVE